MIVSYEITKQIKRIVGQIKTIFIEIRKFPVILNYAWMYAWPGLWPSNKEKIKWFRFKVSQ